MLIWTRFFQCRSFQWQQRQEARADLRQSQEGHPVRRRRRGRGARQRDRDHDDDHDQDGHRPEGEEDEVEGGEEQKRDDQRRRRVQFRDGTLEL